MSKELASNPELLTTENIVMSLMEGYTGKGRVVYLDNFYTTPSLATKLLDVGTLMVGTVRLNRKNFQTDLAKARPEKGQSIFYAEEKKACLLFNIGPLQTGPIKTEDSFSIEYLPRSYHQRYRQTDQK